MISFILVLLLVPALIYRAWVLTMLWGWFLVPLGLPPVTIPLAGGIIMLGMYLTWQAPDDSKETTLKTLARMIARSIISPLFFLGMGFLAHLWMINQ